MALQIPTVTVEDLHAFHAKHFAHAAAPEHIIYGVDTEVPEEYPEEPDLGYYEDGVQRTLTDEQIAIFRHSEIQRIIRERRRRRDNNESVGEEAKAAPSHSPSNSAQTDDPDTHVDESTQTKPAAGVTRHTQSGGIDKPKDQQWATSSSRTKARNKRNRDRYKAKKKDARLKREQAWKNKDAEESDEWDPWHQAKGPDVQQDDTVDLDY